jgi:hypothetical protein
MIASSVIPGESRTGASGEIAAAANSEGGEMSDLLQIFIGIAATRPGRASAVALTVTLAVGNVLAADKSPVGPELAPREIRVLLKAYPILVQGVGVTLWGATIRSGRP